MIGAVDSIGLGPDAIMIALEGKNAENSSDIGIKRCARSVSQHITLQT